MRKDKILRRFKLYVLLIFIVLAIGGAVFYRARSSFSELEHFQQCTTTGKVVILKEQTETIRETSTVCVYSLQDTDKVKAYIAHAFLERSIVWLESITSNAKLYFPLVFRYEKGKIKFITTGAIPLPTEQMIYHLLNQANTPPLLYVGGGYEQGKWYEIPPIIAEALNNYPQLIIKLLKVMEK